MPQLDSLRALAFFGVAASHWIAGDSLFTFLGGTGVQLFFVLSGFLITGILLEYRQETDTRSDLTRGSALRTFYARRMFRIFPLFYATIIAAAVLNVGPIRESWPWHALYGSNYLYGIWGRAPGDPFTHFWSLGVEEQFYLVWPFLVFAAGAARLERLTLALIVGAPIFRIALEAAFPAMHRVNYLPFSCGDSLGVGAALAIACHRGSFVGATPSVLARHMARVAIAGALLSAGALFAWNNPFWALSAGHSSLVLFYGWLVFHAGRGFQGAAGRLLDRPELRFIGRISYGLYVFHNFFTFLNISELFGAAGLPKVWAEPLPVQLAVRLACTFLAAIASWYLYEGPLNSLKRFFTLREKAGTAESAGAASVLT
jgi:peptidoglycan/LPS O-acetylase OafA/YrhL